MKAHELTSYIRRNLNNFVDQSVSDFRPFGRDEKKLWDSDDFSGAIVLIDMKVFGVLNPDSGCVVATRRTNNEWMFSTINAGGSLESLFGDQSVSHPVSGNRAFGIYKTNSGKYVFYTVAADRPTRRLDQLAGFLGILPDAQARLWKSFQEKVIRFINENEGSAKPGLSEARNYDWEEVFASPYYDVTAQPDWR